MPYCSNCGNQMKDGDRFCMKCGSPANVQAVTANNQSVASPIGRAIVCEMCNGRDIMKADGFYVCQNCGTKYSVEEARKLMVQVQGTVKVDKTAELNNAITLARRAQHDKNYVNAQKYYEQILLSNPDNWEANFFSILYAAMNSSNTVESAAAVSGSLETSLTMMKNSVDPKYYGDILSWVFNELQPLSQKLYKQADKEFYSACNDSRSGGHASYASIGALCSRLKDASEIFDAGVKILHYYGNCVWNLFDEQYRGYAVSAYKNCVQMYNNIHDAPGQKYINEKLYNQLLPIVRSYKG